MKLELKHIKTKARNHSNNNKGKQNSNGGISCTLIAFHALRLYIG